MAREGGLIGRLQEAVETRSGKKVIDVDRLQLLEASDVERRAMAKELDLLGYFILDQLGGQPQEVKPQERRRMAAQARMVWIQDPVAGANVDLSCQFIFGRGVPKPKAVDAKVQEVIDEAWCHDEMTEALTDEGWLGLDELQARWEQGTLPAVAGWRDGAIVYERPVAMMVSERVGSMLRFRTQQMDMRVTPNHRMVVRAQSGRSSVKRADEIQSRGWRVPASAESVSGVEVEEFVLPGVLVRERRRSLAGIEPKRPVRKKEHEPITIPMDAWLNWLGWWLAEGHASYGGARPSWSVFVCQAAHSPLLGKLKAACAALGIGGRERVAESRWGGKWIWAPRLAKQLGTWLTEHCLEDGEKRIPDFVFALSARQQALLLDGLLAGDANYKRIMERSSGAFYTGSAQLAHDVQRLAVNCGWKATLRSRKRPNLKTEWALQLNHRREHWLPTPVREDYVGRVWCFRMPSGALVTRRNGCVAISGNSDPDNKAALTTFPAQVALCTDLVLQSNLFVLFFEGEDGKVKLGILDHDLVEDAVRDSNNRLRVLYYVARRRAYRWDYANDRMTLQSQANMQESGRPRVAYYQALGATDPETGQLDTEDETCPPEKLGEGLVYHIAINRGSEQVFGIPAMRRIVKWMAALNDFMAARVDLTQAAAAFIMRRTVKGSPQQVASIAAKALSRTSSLAASSIDDPAAGTVKPGPRPASILSESEGVKTEPFSVSTQAAQAQQDAQMIRSQISSSTWPQHYLGDQSNANLATASALELPVVKKVEAFQELFEGLFRTFIDRVIQRAVDSGRLPTELTPEERARLRSKKPSAQVPGGEGIPPEEPGQQEPALAQTDPLHARLGEAYHGQTEDEVRTERDLGYEFSMPNPLKRSMADLVTAIANLARTFDPNNTNLELSRTLLAVALGQGLELADPAAAVERILPEGYIDPMLAGSMGGSGQPGGEGAPGSPPPLIPTGPNLFGPGGERQPTEPMENPYSAQGQSSRYRESQGQLGEAVDAERMEEIMQLWDEELGPLIDQMLETAAASSNGGP